MSLAFVHKGVIYADRFQLTDFIDYVPSLTDQKIFVSKDKKVIIAVMGKELINVSDTLAEIGRIKKIYLSAKRRNASNEAVGTLLAGSFAHLEFSGLVVFKFSADLYVTLRCEYSGDKSARVYVNELKAPVSMCGPVIIPELLRHGVKPARIFYGICKAFGSVSKEYTSYDFINNKFLETEQ